LQSFISAFFQWKKTYVGTPKEPRFHELMETAALRRGERTFYSVGPTEQEAYRVLDEQLTNLDELARFIVARVAATVLEDEAVLTNGTFIENIDLENLRFDPTKSASMLPAVI
jgi:hypothetical protein